MCKQKNTEAAAPRNNFNIKAFNTDENGDTIKNSSAIPYANHAATEIGGDVITTPEVAWQGGPQELKKRIQLPRNHSLPEFQKHIRNISHANGTFCELEQKGVLLLSFDDRYFQGWLDALPLFAKFDAHATFFISGDIDNEATRVMKTLSEAGHSLGLHGLNHMNADEGIAQLGIEGYYDADIVQQRDKAYCSNLLCTSFAYPNCRHTDESDNLFYSKGFLRVRGGVTGATPYDPTGEKQKLRRPLPTNNDVFFPVSELSQHRCINTIIMGEAYHTDISEIISCLKRANKQREVISITSHDIAPDAKQVHMKIEWLEQILDYAKSIGLATIGFDELPECTSLTN